MTDLDLIHSLGLIVVAAALLVLVTRALKIPTIVSYIVAGLILGPITGILEVAEVIEIIAEVGIVLLLFLVGLELSFDRIKDVGRVAIIAGIGQVVFTAAGGFVLAYLLGFNAIQSIFIATALTFSSTVVVVKLLDEKKELSSLYGRIAVGIFLVQDLVVIFVLTLLSGLSNPEAMAFALIASSIGMAFLGMGLLLVMTLLASRYVLPLLFRWIAGSPEAMFIWSLFWCFLIVILAELLRLSPEIGAFLAGISLAQLPYNHDLRRRVHPLMNFFIAIFFVSLGINMEMTAAAAHLGSAVIFSLFVLLGNPFIFMWIIAKMGYSERTSFLTSVTVAQISEFSFIFAAMALGAGLIDEAILSLIAVVGLVTIGASSYMIYFNHELYGVFKRLRLLRMFSAGQEDEEDERPELKGHVIVVGINTMSLQIIEGLQSRGESVLAIDTDPRKLQPLTCDTLLGDAQYPSVLEEAQLPAARLLVSTLQIEDTNNLLAYRCKMLGIPCSIHAFDQSLVRDLQAIGADHLILSKNEGIQRMAHELRSRGVL